MSTAAANNPLMASMNEMFRSVANAEPTEVDISLIDVKPQARKVFEDENNSLAGLAATFKKVGVLQPVVLRPRPGGRYELVAGERRLRAAKLAGLTKIPCRIRKQTDSDSALAQLIENIQRKNLEPIEEAEALKQALADHGGDRAALLAVLGKSDTWLTQRLNLLDLPPQTQRLVRDGLSSDVSTINSMRQLEKANPAAAKALVDEAAEKPGSTQLRAKTDAAKKEAKVHLSSKKASAPGKPAGPAPSTATPRDRSQEEPSTGTVSPGGGIFPAAPMKPHEKAIVTLVDGVRKPGSDPAKLLASLDKGQLDLVEKHGQTYFDRGQKTEDLASALVSGLGKGEFGKGAVELFNLVVFLQGQAKASRFEIEKALAKLTSGG